MFYIDLCHHVQYVYFEVDNKYWNPFNSKHTQINFKSIAMSSFMNLLLFVLKPIIKTICRFGKLVIKHKTCTIADKRVDGKLTQRSYLLHKRPIIKWYTKKHNLEIAHAKNSIA